MYPPRKTKIYAGVLVILALSIPVLLVINYFVSFDLMFPWIIIVCGILFINLVIFAALRIYQYSKYLEHKDK